MGQAVVELDRAGKRYGRIEALQSGTKCLEAPPSGERPRLAIYGLVVLSLATGTLRESD